MTTSNALTSVAAVSQSARTHQNPAVRVISKETTLPYGNTVRQGDVMLTRHPLGTEFKQVGAETDNHQLAPGSTAGSRHILRRGPMIQSRVGASVLTGPVVVAPVGFYLEHPDDALKKLFDIHSDQLCFCFSTDVLLWLAMARRICL